MYQSLKSDQIQEKKKNLGNSKRRCAISNFFAFKFNIIQFFFALLKLHTVLFQSM